MKRRNSAMKMAQKFRLMAIAVAFVLSWSAQGAILQVTFQGTLDSIGDPPFWDGSLQVGTPFTETYVFDTSVSDANPGNPNHGDYSSYGAPYFGTLTAGNYTFSIPRVTLNVFYQNGGNQNGYNLNTVTGTFGMYGLTLVSFGNYLLNNNNSLFTSDAAQVQQFPISIFTAQRNLSFVGLDGLSNPHYLAGTASSYTVTSLDSTTIPEPTVSALLGLGGLLVFRRRSASCGGQGAR